MSVIAIEGVVENGEIRLPKSVCLPENTTVYVIIPNAKTEPPLRIMSPRLVHQEEAKDFAMQVTEASSNAAV